MSPEEVVHAGDEYLLPICGSQEIVNGFIRVAFIETQVTCPECIKIQLRHA